MNRLMLKTTSQLVLLVWVISLAVPLAGSARVWASDAPSACDTAESACTEFENEDEWVATICKDPDPMPSNVTVAEYEANKASCKENAKLAWGQVGPSCEVMKFSDLQSQDQTWLAACYAVVSASCFVAYGLQQSGVAIAAGVALGTACGIASIVVGGFDLGYSMGRKAQAGEALGGITAMDVISGVAGAGMGTYGTVVGAAGFAEVSKAAETAEKAATKVTEEVAEETAVDASKEASKETTKEATKGSATASLLTAITTAALAGLKFSSLSGTAATKESACTVISDSASHVLTLSGTPLLPDSGVGGGSASTGASSAGAGVASSSGLESKGKSSDGLKKLLSSPEAFSTAAATAGRLDPKLGEFFKKVPPKDLFNQLKSANPNFGSLAAAAAQGNFAGVSSALGDITKKDQKLAGALDAADKEFKKRMAALRAQEVQGTQYAKGKGGQSGSSASKGKAGAGTGTNPFAGLMGGAGGGGDGPDALKFTGGPAAPTQAPADAGDPNDLFHAQERGTLFDIVSRRVGRTRDRVEAYEWDSPINRLIENLPHKAADEPLRKPAGKRAP